MLLLSPASEAGKCGTGVPVPGSFEGVYAPFSVAPLKLYLRGSPTPPVSYT